MFWILFVLLLVVSLVYFLNTSYRLIDRWTRNIQRPWLQNTLRIAAKTGATVVLVFGFLSTLFMAFVLQYDKKKGRK